MTKIAEVMEKGADYSLTALSAIFGNKTIKEAYDLTEKYAPNMSDAYPNNKDMKKALISTRVETLIDTASGEIGGDIWHFTAQMGTFKYDAAEPAGAEKSPVSREGKNSLENLRNKTRSNSNEAEKAARAAADAAGQTAKDRYDNTSSGMDKYDRSLKAENTQKFLRDVADKKAAMKKEQALRAAEKELKEYRNAIRKNAQKPL